MYIWSSYMRVNDFHFTGVIRAAAGEETGTNLETLLRRDKSKLDNDCYNRALKVAVESGKCSNAEKLILAGATNIDEALEKATLADIKLMLLMVKAVLEDDDQFIVEVKKISRKETGSQLSKYLVLYTEEMTKHITTGRVRTKVPIKLTIKLNKLGAMLNKLLSITNIKFDSGSVGWSNLSLNELNIEWIRNLPRNMPIKQMNLSQNELKILPISVASYLRNCTKLDLRQNHITDIPTSILKLPLIRNLKLSRNKISQLPNVSWSASLVHLDLSYNQLKDLPDCAAEVCADSMEVLRLEHNQLKRVPECVCFLYNLNILNISHNPEILGLPVKLGRLNKLKQLTLNGLENLYDPAPSIRENTATLLSYLRSQFRKKLRYYRMKLMLVGKETVGKTTLVACLRGKQYLGGSTVGVDIGNWSYRPSFFKPSFSFSVWDFAGQQEYYATHQVFLSKRSLYLIVWNVTKEREGISELKPWVNNIVLRAPESRIVIVATHLDLLISNIGKQQAYAKCEEYKIYITQSIGQNLIEHIAKIMFVGLKGKCENVSQLKDEIYKAAEGCKFEGHLIMGSSIPASYEKVDSKLLKIPDPGILHAIEFKEIVRGLGQPDVQSDDEIRALTLFLHDIGSLLHFDDHRHNLDDLYFVKPQWLSKLMAKVIKVDEEQRKKYITDGKITKSNVKQLFEKAGKSSSEEYDLFEQYLMLFNRFEIVLPADKHGDQLLIPCFLPSVRPTTVDTLNREYRYRRKFEFCDSFTPPGLWSRLLSRLMKTITQVRDIMDQVDSQNGELCYWNTGLYCHSDGLLFIIESSASQDDGISITYSSKAAEAGLLGQLVNLVQQIVSEWYPGLKFEQTFYCYGSTEEECSGNFKLDELLDCIAEKKSLNCQICHKNVDLNKLAPDLLLVDMDANFVLDINTIQYDMNVIWNGRFGNIHRGEMHSTTRVILKFYDTNNEDSQAKNYEGQFQSFQAEIIYLKRIKHPCLVGMIGVCGYPKIALVMEDGPIGSLDSCLLKELVEVSRIVVYRIAAQLASALRFLHSIPIIYRRLTTSKILVWSLSLNNLVNCKLACLQISAYGGAEHVENTFAHQFIAPEVSKQALYDRRVDIYSLGVVLLHLMQRNYPNDFRQSIPEWEILPTLSIPDSELHHMRSLAKRCCSYNPADRPDLVEIVEQMCNPIFQLVMNVTVFDGTIDCACAQDTETSITTSQTDSDTDAWLCHQSIDGSEIIAITLKGLKVELDKRVFIKDRQIYSMVSHENNLWAVPIRTVGHHKGSLLKFDGGKKDKYIEVPIQCKTAEGDDILPDGDYGFSLACYGDRVYVGTAGGWCVVFPTDINNQALPILKKKLSNRYIRSLIVVKKTSLLWVSTDNDILFINSTDLEFNDDNKPASIATNDWRVGKFLLSPDEEIMWTVHIDGHSISAWKAQGQELICPLSSYELMDRNIDQKNSKIASASPVLDMLWVGLVSGHILVVSTASPQKPLIIMDPYNQKIGILIPIYDKDNDNPMVISIGKDYQFAEKSKKYKEGSVDIVLWEVVTGAQMLQLKHLSSGNAWMNKTSLDEVRT